MRKIVLIKRQRWDTNQIRMHPWKKPWDMWCTDDGLDWRLGKQEGEAVIGPWREMIKPCGRRNQVTKFVNLLTGGLVCYHDSFSSVKNTGKEGWRDCTAGKWDIALRVPPTNAPHIKKVIIVGGSVLRQQSGGCYIHVMPQAHGGSSFVRESAILGRTRPRRWRALTLSVLLSPVPSSSESELNPFPPFKMSQPLSPLKLKAIFFGSNQKSSDSYVCRLQYVLSTCPSLPPPVCIECACVWPCIVRHHHFFFIIPRMALWSTDRLISTLLTWRPVQRMIPQQNCPLLLSTAHTHTQLRVLSLQCSIPQCSIEQHAVSVGMPCQATIDPTHNR